MKFSSKKIIFLLGAVCLGTTTFAASSGTSSMPQSGNSSDAQTQSGGSNPNVTDSTSKGDMAYKDVEITGKIREKIVGEDDLSIQAKNIQILTENGQVTLKGIVKSQAEKSSVDKIAKSVVGPAQVVNQLVIARTE